MRLAYRQTCWAFSFLFIKYFHLFLIMFLPSPTPHKIFSTSLPTQLFVLLSLFLSLCLLKKGERNLIKEQQVLQITSWLGVGTHVHFSPSALGLHLACAGQALCLLPQLLCGAMYSCPVVFEDTVSLESSITSGSCNLSTSSYMYIPDPQ